RNRYHYPKGPRNWRNIKDAISFHRKKRENLLALAIDYPDSCTIITHVGRLVLLNDSTLINEIFIGRADLVNHKVDEYLENQLRYKEGKHIRTGIVFRHQDHNARIIHKALVKHLDDNLIGKHLDSLVQEQLKQIRLAEKFDVRLLTSLTCSSAMSSIDDKAFELFEQNLYKVSKVIHEDTIEKSAKVALTQLTGLSETLDINENVLDYIKTWITYRHSYINPILDIIDNSSPRLDEDDIAACVLDVIMHGIKYPEEADTCRCEARDNGYITFNLSLTETLRHTQAFVKEVLRLSPVVPVIIHSTLQDFKWRNFHIQKRTLFGANVFALHHSIAWKESTKFDLTRWLEQDASIIPIHSYLPFDIGPRTYIAEKYFFNLLTDIFAVLLYYNDFDKAGSLPEPTKGTFDLTNMPPKYSLKGTPL
ncbi:unnamed protein product, partial [Rotaria sordida]